MCDKRLWHRASAGCALCGRSAPFTLREPVRAAIRETEAARVRGFPRGQLVCELARLRGVLANSRWLALPRCNRYLRQKQKSWRAAAVPHPCARWPCFSRVVLRRPARSRRQATSVRAHGIRLYVRARHCLRSPERQSGFSARGRQSASAPSPRARARRERTEEIR